MNARTACPFLKEVVMIYCDACPQHKLLPRNQVVTMGPCACTDYHLCPLFREVVSRGLASGVPVEAGRNGNEREVRP